jgi:hypoxanthine phosphoribosyltransferase
MLKRSDLEVLIDEKTLHARIAEMGEEISRDYQGKDLALVGILKGSFVFLADLARALNVECTIDFLGLSSYGHETTTTGVVKITSDLTAPIEGRDVLIVEDIIDTGLTMAYLLENLTTRRPASVRVCTLLHKPVNARTEIPIDYTGFTIDDHFVIGYGLDYEDKFRNVPFIGHKVT